MTPRFAEAVDPIFLRVFSLLERLDSGAAIAPAEEKRELENLIAQADRCLSGESKNWGHAKYALVSWIDEMLIDAHIWPGQDWWRDNVLEWSVFHSRRCNELYYVKANSALNAGLDDAIQMIYVCVMLGFRGLYRDPRLNRMLIDQHGLKDDLSGWAEEYASAVAQARQRLNDATAAQSCQREIVTAVPLASRALAVWPWLLTTVLAGWLALVHFYH
jgi:type VI secretion system protein ImpK